MKSFKNIYRPERVSSSCVVRRAEFFSGQMSPNVGSRFSYSAALGYSTPMQNLVRRYSSTNSDSEVGAHFISGYCQQLNHTSSNVRVMAAKALGDSRAATKEVIEALNRRLNVESYSPVENAILETLSKLSEIATLEVVSVIIKTYCRQLNHTSSNVRVMVAKALGDSGAATKEVIEALHQRLNVESYSPVENAILEALSKLRERKRTLRKESTNFNESKDNISDIKDETIEVKTNHVREIPRRFLDHVTILNLSSEDLFLHLSENGSTWSDILNKYVFNENLIGHRRAEKRDLVVELIKKRDLLDGLLYKGAIERLFPIKNFTVRHNPKANSRYFYSIYLAIPPSQMYEPNPYLTIEIQAPGSRTLTSDIDTTISVIINKEAGKTLPLNKLVFPELYKDTSNRDIELLLQLSIVHYFNRQNLEKLGLTGASSRDSNVYVDGFLNPRGYPRFNETDQFLKHARDLFKDPSKESLQEFYQKYKGNKQKWELAANLVSLREYFDLTKREWNDFIIKIKENFPEQWRSVFYEDLTVVSVLVGKLCDYKKEELEKIKNNKSFQSDYEYYAKLEKGSKAYEKDYEVHALNCLYEKHLYEQALVLSNVERKKNEIGRLLEEINGLKVEIEKQQLTINYEKDRSKLPQDLKKTVEKAKETKKELENEIKARSLQLKEKFKDLANLYNKQQEAQIKANLFANEAYISRSAPYHVVLGQSQKITPSELTKKQVILGSVLHQIGFRLLHAEHYRESGMPIGEIFYRVAKYGVRVEEMLFGTSSTLFEEGKVLTQGEVKSIREGTMPVLDRLITRTQTDLNRSRVKNYNKYFEELEYGMLNRDGEFVKEIKKNFDLDEYQKGDKAYRLYRKHIYLYEYPEAATYSDKHIEALSMSKDFSANVQDWIDTESNRWISMAVKMVRIVYKAQLEQKGVLWGKGFFRAPQVTTTTLQAKTDISMTKT